MENKAEIQNSNFKEILKNFGLTSFPSGTTKDYRIKEKGLVFQLLLFFVFLKLDFVFIFLFILGRFLFSNGDDLPRVLTQRYPS